MDWRVARMMPFGQLSVRLLAQASEFPLSPEKSKDSILSSLKWPRYCLDPKFNTVLDPATAYEVQPPGLARAFWTLSRQKKSEDGAWEQGPQPFEGSDGRRRGPKSHAMGVQPAKCRAGRCAQ